MRMSFFRDTDSLDQVLPRGIERPPSLLQDQIDILEEKLSEAINKLAVFPQLEIPTTTEAEKAFKASIKKYDKEIKALNKEISSYKPSRFQKLWNRFYRFWYGLISDLPPNEIKHRDAKTGSLTIKRDKLARENTMRKANLAHIPEIIDISTRYTQKKQELNLTEGVLSDSNTQKETLIKQISPYTIDQKYKIKSSLFDPSEKKELNKYLKYVAKSLSSFLKNPVEATRTHLFETTKTYANYQAAPNANAFNALLKKANEIYDIDEAMPEKTEHLIHPKYR